VNFASDNKNKEPVVNGRSRSSDNNHKIITVVRKIKSYCQFNWASRTGLCLCSLLFLYVRVSYQSSSVKTIMATWHGLRYGSQLWHLIFRLEFDLDSLFG
jgi:hypothetical protein